MRDLSYDAETGNLLWKRIKGRIPKSGIAGRVMHHHSGKKYRIVRYKNHYYLAHRLAWLIQTNSWPALQIDHIDGDSMNNRWSNLREVSPSENQKNLKKAKNNTSGVTGVYLEKRTGKWRSSIQVGGKTVHLGRSKDFNEAVAWRKSAEEKYGFHRNHGS